MVKEPTGPQNPQLVYIPHFTEFQEQRSPHTTSQQKQQQQFTIQSQPQLQQQAQSLSKSEQPQFQHPEELSLIHLVPDVNKEQPSPIAQVEQSQSICQVDASQISSSTEPQVPLSTPITETSASSVTSQSGAVIESEKCVITQERWCVMVFLYLLFAEILLSMFLVKIELKTLAPLILAPHVPLGFLTLSVY